MVFGATKMPYCIASQMTCEKKTVTIKLGFFCLYVSIWTQDSKHPRFATVRCEMHLTVNKIIKLKKKFFFRMLMLSCICSNA